MESQPEPQSNQPSPSPLGRRRFIEICAGVGTVFTVGAFARLAPSARAAALVRPPGGQHELRVAALCVKCNRCEEVCPTRVIAIAKVEDGLLAARTPKLNFKLGYCTFCMKCVDVCPTRALEPVEKSKARIGLAEIQKDYCIPWQWGGCTKCYERCPVKAIRLDDQKRPIIDEARCNGCGLCEQICPATELRSSSSGGVQRGVIILPPAPHAG